MTTRLDSEVTRLTTLIVEGREVDVTLRPANPTTLDPEYLVLHQKGLKTEKAIPLTAILKAIGWKVEGPKIERADTNEDFHKTMNYLEAALRPWKEMS